MCFSVKTSEPQVLPHTTYKHSFKTHQRHKWKDKIITLLEKSVKEKGLRVGFLSRKQWSFMKSKWNFIKIKTFSYCKMTFWNFLDKLQLLRKYSYIIYESIQTVILKTKGFATNDEINNLLERGKGFEQILYKI